MDHSDSKYSISGQWQGHLTQLKFARKSGDTPHETLNLTLTQSEHGLILVRFAGVRGLEIANLCSNFVWNVRAIDVRGDQLEGINFRVEEKEPALLKLECEDLHVDTIELKS